jgi:hypothetical protein
MDRKEICNLWIEYLKESNFKKENGEARFLSYIDRIKASSEIRRLTPWPTVQKTSDMIEILIDQAHSQANSRGDLSFEYFKKRLIENIKSQEKTNLFLYIHVPGISPRGGQKVVLQEVGRLLKAKLNDAKDIRDFYLTWTAPGERIVPELALYLKLYRLRNQGETNDQLAKIARKSISKRLKKDENDDGGYESESQVSRAIGYAGKILRNVEKGCFPGDYKSIP